MKKFISSTLAIVMLLTMMLSGISVSADTTEVSFGKTDLVNIGTFLSDLMITMGGGTKDSALTPEEGAQRTLVANMLSSYFLLDGSIDKLIEIVNSGTADAAEEADKGLMNSLLGNMDPDKLAEIKAPVVFMLKVYKSTKAEDRQEAINAFYTDVPVELNDDETAALEYFYDMLVSEDVQTVLGQTGTGYGKHNISAGTLLHLIEAFDGCFKFTDNEYEGKELALKANSISDDFADKIETVLVDYTIGGEPANDAEALLEKVAEIANDELSEDEIADLKLVLGAVNLYEAKEESSGGRRKGSGGSSSAVVTPEPTTEPTVEPTTEPTYVPDAEVIPAPDTAKEEYVFDDTEDHWSKDYVAYLAEREIFKGYEDGSFKPDIGVTREEMAVVMIRVIDKEHKLGDANETTFADNDEIAAWARESVNLTVKKGIFTGYDDNTFKPNRVISREEMVAILMRAIDSNVMLEELDYTDLADIGHWSVDYVNKATAKGIIKGYEDGSFKPKASITRAEAAKMVYNFMYVMGLLDAETVVTEIAEESSEPATEETATETENTEVSQEIAEAEIETIEETEVTEETTEEVTTEEVIEEVIEEEVIEEEAIEEETTEEA